MTDSTEADAGNTSPRWGRRILLTLGLLALLLAGGMWIMSRQARSNLEARIADYRVRGVPILPADFDPKPIPDDQNAALLYERAMTAMQIPQDQRDWFRESFDFELPLDEADVENATKLAGINTEALELAREARGKPGMSWNLKFSSPVMTTLMAPGSPGGVMNECRSLAQLLATDAMLQFATGNHGAAIERLRDIHALSRAVDQQPLVLINHLVAIGIAALACEQTTNMAPALQVNGAGGATPEQIRALIADLRDETISIASAKRGWEGERMIAVASLQSMALQRGPLGLLVRRDAIVALDNFDEMIEAVSQPSYPQAMKAMPAAPQGAASRVLRPWSSMMIPAWTPSLRNEYRIRLQRRVAATALAIQLYRAEHDGALPGTMDALAPNYLKAVPLDPFSPTDAPLKYSATPTPLIYSVGEDGKDDNASSAQTNTNRKADRWGGRDYVFRLVESTEATTNPVQP